MSPKNFYMKAPTKKPKKKPTSNTNFYMGPPKEKPKKSKKPKDTSGQTVPETMMVNGVKKQLRMPRYIMVNGVRTKLY